MSRALNLSQRLVLRMRYFNELVAFEHTIFSLPFILIAMLTSAQGWFGWRLFVLAILAAVAARNFAMAVNRFLDRDIDAKNPRTASRPSVDGRVSPREMIFFILGNAALFMAVAYAVNPLAFKVAFPVLAILAFYSCVKRFSALAHLILGLSLGLAPLAGVIAVEAAVPLWAMPLSLGVLFWVAGFDILYSLQDREFDQREGLYSIPARFGEVWALWLSRLFHAMALCWWLLFVILTGGSVVMLLSWALCGAMLLYEHGLVSRDFRNIPKAFFTVNGYLGIIFLLGCIVDKVV